MNELAALFLDEAYGDEGRRRGRGRASTSGGGARLDDDARGTTTTPTMKTTTTTTTTTTRGGARDGRADAHASPSSSSRPPRPPDRGTTTVSGWLASLWDALLAEDGDEWADARRGRGGTLTGARALKNIELGVEQEMEVVLRDGRGRESSAGTASGETAEAAAAAARRRRRRRSLRRSASSGGYFFGDDEEEEDGEDEEEDEDEDDASSTTTTTSAASESEVTSAPRCSEHLPNVFPGQKVRALGPAKTDARAAEMQRLWGNPNAYVTADECRDVVRSLSEADVARRAMDERLENWAVTVDVRDGDGEPFDADDLLEFWRRRCVALCDVFLEALEGVGGRFESCSTTPRHRQSLLVVVEGYVSGGVKRKLLREGVFPAYADEDARERERLRRIAALPIDALGLRVARHGAIFDDDACARSMASLEDATCPAHAARLLVDVLTRARELCSTTDHPLDADDELLVLLVLLARADLERPHSIATYVETFLGLASDARKGEGGFAAATLCGAARYARSDAMRDMLDAREREREQ